MQMNVSQLLREAVGSTREHDIDGTADINGDGKEYPVQGQVNLLRTQRSILAKVRLSTEVDLTCSRCLASYPRKLDLEFEEEYVPTVDVISGMVLPPPEEPGSFTIDDHHILDLTEAVRQYTVMAIPMKPLCRQDCAGLCQQCGHNLNKGPCDCPTEVIDPRWSELIKLL